MLFVSLQAPCRLYFPDSKIAVAVETNRDVAADVDELVLEIAQRVRRELRR